MSLATLSDVLTPALRNGYAVGGLVTLGWEDMLAYVKAAQTLGVPIILQAGPSCRKHTPLPILGKMFRYLADSVDVPVVAHLDHGYTYEECKIALESGFTSLMYDGSRKPLQQNIDETAAIVEMAHKANISCEGEIGFVGYQNGDHSKGTDPDEANLFASGTGVDAMAISCGNVHLQEQKQGGLDLKRIKEIEVLTNLPLVIHGGSGVPVEQRKNLSRNSNICKFNIGTELRMVFGNALRKAIDNDKARFDRVQIMEETIDPVYDATVKVLKSFGGPNPPLS
jgi:fructose-bisphosphate aldolase class II